MNRITISDKGSSFPFAKNYMTIIEGLMKEELNQTVKNIKMKPLPKEKTQNPTYKEEVVRKIIHEIRNPITAISLANQSIREAARKDGVAGSVELFTDIISRNTASIEEMLKNLLIGNCDSESPFIHTDVCYILDDSLAKAKDRIYLKQVNVNKSYTPGIMVHGNHEKLSLAFLNIIINAIEAVDAVDGNLWIATYQSQNEVKVIFKDNGIGMNPEVAAHMFDEKFSRKPHGLGVGLAHVKEILNAHNADVIVNSQPGFGTSVVVVFKAL